MDISTPFPQSSFDFFAGLSERGLSGPLQLPARGLGSKAPAVGEPPVCVERVQGFGVSHERAAQTLGPAVAHKVRLPDPARRETEGEERLMFHSVSNGHSVSIGSVVSNLSIRFQTFNLFLMIYGVSIVSIGSYVSKFHQIRQPDATSGNERATREQSIIESDETWEPRKCL
jgi:hypothetical protein